MCATRAIPFRVRDRREASWRRCSTPRRRPSKWRDRLDNDPALIDRNISVLIQRSGGYEAQKIQAIDTCRQTALGALECGQAELDTVREQARDAQSTRKRVVVEAPVSGTAIRVKCSGFAGVIEAGKVVAEILPTDVPPIVETMIARTDIDAVSVGQTAAVRFSALNQRTTLILDGEVCPVSADAIVDKEGDAARVVYLARIKPPVNELTRVPGFAPVPGMPVQVMIQTAECTFAQYVDKPVVDSMQRALREN